MPRSVVILQHVPWERPAILGHQIIATALVAELHSGAAREVGIGMPKSSSSRKHSRSTWLRRECATSPTVPSVTLPTPSCSVTNASTATERTQ